MRNINKKQYYIEMFKLIILYNKITKKKVV